jgi:hypothetical protein
MILGLWLLECCLLGSCKGRDNPPYSFFIDGQTMHPRWYSLSGDTATIQAGDVITVASDRVGRLELHLTLGETQECRFVRTPPYDGRLLLETGSGPPVAVGAVVYADSGYPGGIVNPLATMSPDEIKRLWGIYLADWPKGIERLLAHVDTDRVCVSLSGSAALGGVELMAGRDDTGKPFPSLPENLRHLMVLNPFHSGTADYSSIRNLRELTLLTIQFGPYEGFDTRIISGNANLRHLSLVWSNIAHPEAMSGLTGLQFLDISHATGVESLEFVRSMHQLKVLRLDATDVTSLSPLDGSPLIREIRAANTSVKDLPAGELPLLRVLNVLGAKVPKDVAERFAAAHSQCVVHYSWTDSLRRSLEGANRLRVRSRLAQDPRKDLFETTDPNEIRRLIALLEVDDAQSGGHVMEDSLRVLEFYKGDEPLARIGCVFLRWLRWESSGPWPGDGRLTGKSTSFLAQWLRERGANISSWEL